MTAALANIAGALDEIARVRPDAPAIHLPLSRGPAATRTYRTLTYAELNAASNRVASGLAAVGLQRGQRAALMVPPSPELFALVFGLYKAGVVPVMIDPGIGMRRLGVCLDQAEPHAFIGISLAHAVRTALGWGNATVKTLVTVGRRWFWGGATYGQLLAAGSDDAEIAATDPDDVAAILFTSGATGPPKGVVYRHRHFAAQVEMIGGMYGIEQGEIDLPTFPLFALFDPALGMTTVIPRMNFTKPAAVDPTEIIGAVQRFKATNMFGSPALLDVVSSYAADRQIRLPTLRRVITAGAPVRTDILRRARLMIAEDGCIHTPYGATENLPVATIESREVLAETAAQTAAGAGVCVGVPHPRNDVRIMQIAAEPAGPRQTGEPQARFITTLAHGQIGEITCRGPSTTDTYFGLSEQTNRAKIEEPEGVRHRMGDAGYLDAQGRLWYCGRLAHRLQMPDGPMFTLPAEGIFNAQPGVLRVALVGVHRAGELNAVIVWEGTADSPHSAAEISTQLAAVAQQHDATRAVRDFLHYGKGKGLPVDIRHNAKIDRPQLAVWAAKRLGAA
jgi:olefin beta-lactone synthetase